MSDHQTGISNPECGASILIVDDTHANLQLLTSILTKRGYKVRPASNGPMALAAAQADPPDLVLLDIMMPEMDGYAVCEHLKADERTQDIPIIFISALSETLDKIKAFSIGGVDYITKPFQVEEVMVRIKTHLAIRKLQKRLRTQNVQLQQEIAERERAEAELRALFLAMPDNVLVLDRQGRYVKTAPTPPELMREPADELLGKTLHEVFPKPEADRFLDKIHQSLETNQTVSFEYSFDIDDKEIWLDARISPIMEDTVIVVIRDITQHKQAEEALRQHSHQLALINQASQQFSSTLDLEQVFETVLKEMQHLLDITSISLWLIEPETGDLVCRLAKGLDSSVLGWRLAPGQGITGWVAQHGKSQIVPDAWADERHMKGTDRHTRLGARSMLCIPLRAKGNVIGVLNFLDSKIDVFTPDNLTLLEPIAAAAAIAIDNARLFEEEQKAKEASETANAALAALNTVGFVINSSLDLEADLEKALEIMLQEMKLEHGWILLPEDNGRLLRLVATVGLPDELRQQEALTPVDRCYCGEVLAAGELRCYFEDNACPRLTPYLERCPTLATQHISQPIFAKQKVVGLLNLGGANVANLTADNYEWIETVAQQIGNAIDNALLYQNTLSKADRLSALNRVSTLISLSWELDDVLPSLLREMARVLETSLGLLVLRSEEDRERYRVRTTFGHWQSLVSLNAVAWHELPLLKVIKQTRVPLLVSNAARDERLKPLSTLIEQEHIQTMLVLPLLVQNQLTGFIQLCTIGRERIFEATEMELARTLTNQAAVAIEKARLYEAKVARYEEELELARQIQQNLLPRIVPDLPGLHLAGLCQPAYATGGDFYDYILLPDQRLSIVVGDVTGKSLPAAMVMALARNTVRSELDNNPQPAEAMTAANRWLCRDMRRGTFVAIVQALIDPLKQLMWLVHAGQTATLLVRNGKTQYLLPDQAASFPLGIQPNTVYSQAEIPLQSGDTLLFYTDGIVEAKNAAGDMFSFERLETTIKKLYSSNTPRQIIDGLLAEVQAFVGQAEQHDDITLVVVQVE